MDIGSLSQNRRALLAARLRAGQSAKPRLIAYAVPSGNADPLPIDLRDFLKDRLPPHMVPDHVVPIATLPRLPNGKVDVRSLAAIPEPAAESARGGLVPPSTQAEIILAGIWSDLLGVDPISVTDDFFELGGDSLVSIRMVSMARQQGVEIKPSDLADYPTIETLAKVANSVVLKTPMEAVTDAPLLPIQAWHLTRDMPSPHHWNQAARFALQSGITPEIAQQAVSALVEMHPGLTTQFHRKDAEWRQVLPDGATCDFVVCKQADPATIIEEASASFALDGTLLRFAYVECDDRAAELIIVAHHLVVDAVSWGILADDLDAVLGAAMTGEKANSQTASTALDWATEVADFAASDSARRDVDIWTNTTAIATRSDAGSEAQAGCETLRLDRELSEALLGAANAAFNTQTLDLLVWALAEAQANRTGDANVQIDLEGHGRQPHFSNRDLSRVVGWLTAYYPVNFSLTGTDAAHRGKSVKEDMRAAFACSTSFGAVRYGGDLKLRERLADAQITDVLLNYIGPMNAPTYQHLTALAVPDVGLRAPENPRSHLYEFNVSVIDGCFEVALTYGLADQMQNQAQAFLGAFADQLREIVQVCVNSDSGGFTPSDFPEADISQADLDAFLDEL